MPRVPAISPSPESADAQIDAAVLRLVDLFARQAARELTADAHLMEKPDAEEHPQED
ncbi:MAG: hypothetical protein R3197_17580 [Paracoccaceae bacterium]|nr:hypothetical protein [Paracoccaceae bacterium]